MGGNSAWSENQDRHGNGKWRGLRARSSDQGPLPPRTRAGEPGANTDPREERELRMGGWTGRVMGGELWHPWQCRHWHGPAVTFPAGWPGVRSGGKIASRDGAGESRPRPRQPAGQRCGQTGRVTLCLTPGHLAGPHPALPRPRVSIVTRAVPGSGPELCRGRTELRPCSDPRTRLFSLSAWPPALSRTQPSQMRGRWWAWWRAEAGSSRHRPLLQDFLLILGKVFFKISCWF